MSLSSFGEALKNHPLVILVPLLTTVAVTTAGASWKLCDIERDIQESKKASELQSQTSRQIAQLNEDLRNARDKIAELQAQAKTSTIETNTKSVADTTNDSPINNANSAPTVQKDGFMPGATLEAWLINKGYDQHEPSGPPIGSFVDKGDYFCLDNFKSNPDFQILNDQRIALKWSGFIQVKATGDYQIIFQQLAKTGGYVIWHAFLNIDGTEVFACNEQLNSFAQNAKLLNKTVRLNQGFTPFTLFTYFSELPSESEAVYSKWRYDGTVINLRLSSADSPSPQTLDSKAVFHKE